MWADVRQHLDRLTQPLLVFKSQRDKVVDPLSLKLIEERVGPGSSMSCGWSAATM
jgi:carboxylesterase